MTCPVPQHDACDRESTEDISYHTERGSGFGRPPKQKKDKIYFLRIQCTVIKPEYRP